MPSTTELPLPSSAGNAEEEEEELSNLLKAVAAVTATGDADDDPDPESDPLLLTDELDLETQEKFFKARHDQFVEEIFPQFYIDALMNCELFDQNDLNDYRKKEADYQAKMNDGTRNRLSVYRQLNEWLFRRLQKKLYNDSKTTLGKIIRSFRFHGWYESLAQQWHSHLDDKIKRQRQSLAKLPPPVGIQDSGFGSSSTSTIPPSSPMVKKPPSAPGCVNFPEPVAHAIDREDKQRQLTNDLHRMLDNGGGGWLVLWGGRGTGKTVLAEITARRLSAFTDGKFWLTIGDLGHGDSMMQSLQTKMQVLFELVAHHFPDTMEAWDKFELVKVRLRHHFEENPRSLIILDDVRCGHVLEHFQFGVPVLVTTFDRDQIPYRLSNLSFVSTAREDNSGYPDGNILSREQSLALFKRCLAEHSVHMEYLIQSSALHELLDRVHHHPYYIPLLANWSQPFVQDGYRQFTAAKLEQLQTIWRDILERICQDDEDDLIGPLLSSTLETLPDAIAELLYDFAIFDQPVTDSVLETIWPAVNRIQLAEYLEKLRRKSLMIMMTRGSSSELSNIKKVYTVHDLTARHLRRKLGQENLAERHGRLLDAYFQKYCGENQTDYGGLPDDRYIYGSLAHHLEYSGRHHLFPKILFDLKFLQNKIRFFGQSHILTDYIHYRRHLLPDNGDDNKLNEFRQFIASNTDIYDPQVDLCQVALCQPNTSVVYREARRWLANQRTNSNTTVFYFKWLNKENFWRENSKRKISFLCGPDVETAAVILPDARYIAAGNGCQLQLWNCQTAVLMAEEERHHGRLNHCAVSQDGRMILTSAEDGKAILWTATGSGIVEPGKENRRNSSGAGSMPAILTVKKIFTANGNKFKSDAADFEMGHSLKCGAISSDGRFVLTGSDKGFVHLFSLASGRQLFATANVDHLSHDVECCHFSDDGRHFLFLVSEFVYVYLLSPSIAADDDEDHEEVKAILTHKLCHSQVAHNAVFGSKTARTIFSASDKCVLEWKMKQNSFKPGHATKTVEMSQDGETKKIKRYQLPVDRRRGSISRCAASRPAKLVAGLETTRNEIYFWNRRQYDCPVFYINSFYDIRVMGFDQTGTILFTLSNCGLKSEMTLWDLTVRNPITSMVDLQDNFAATFDRNPPILNVLTIDNNGFLRLFRGVNGVEDKRFKEDLKTKLTGQFVSEQESIQIVCCDISSLASAYCHCLFGTKDGRIFLYRHQKSELHQHRPDQEEIIHCKFIPTETNVRFVSMSRQQIRFYSYAPGLDLTLDATIGLSDPVHDDDDDQFESLHFVSERFLLAWTRFDHICLIDTQTMAIAQWFRGRFQSSITSVHSYRLGNEWLVLVAAASKRFVLLRLTTESATADDSNPDFRLYPWVVSSLANEIPRCCRISYKYLAFGCDSGNLCLISFEQLAANNHSNQNDPLWQQINRPLWRRRHSSAQRWIRQLVISPDDRFIVSAADSIKLWRAQDGTLLQTFITHGEVTRLMVHFRPPPVPPSVQDRQLTSDDDEDEEEESRSEETTTTSNDCSDLQLTVVAITDAQSLYILNEYFDDDDVDDSSISVP